MRLPRINWIRIAENMAACDPYTAALMADGSIQTHGGQVLMARPQSAESVDPQERYQAWCRRAGRAVHPVATAS